MDSAGADPAVGHDAIGDGAVASDRDGDGRPPGGRALRATAGSGRIEPRRQRDRGVAIGRTRGGDGDPARDSIGDDGGTFCADGLREQVEESGEALLGRVVGGQDIHGAGQQSPLRVRGSIAIAPEADATVHESGRRWDVGRVDRGMCRVSVVHLASMVARLVRRGIPPNGDDPPGRRYGPFVSRAGLRCSEPAGQGSGARRR